MTETTARIRWEPTEHGGWTGHVGTIDGFVFQVWKPAPLGDKPWRLESGLPGFFGFHVDSDDPEALKAEAEHHLAVFVTSLGAIFPAGSGEIRETLRSLRCVQAGWAFGVPDDGREQWLDLVAAAVAAPSAPVTSTPRTEG